MGVPILVFLIVQWFLLLLLEHISRIKMPVMSSGNSTLWEAVLG